MGPDRSHFSRISLKRDDAAVKPLLATLMPGAEGEAMAIQHKLLWTLFPRAADHPTPDKKSDAGSPFLWRQVEASGRFFVLGPQPVSASPYFEVESRPFDVAFKKGQRLAFELRCNATVDRMVEPEKGREGRKRVDVVLDAIHQLEKREGTSIDRASRRQSIAEVALGNWLVDQGTRAGFELLGMDAVSYRTVPLPRAKRRNVQVGIVDLHGLLLVTDPVAFSQKLATGFGRMKAFGCGLMLLRPAL